MVRAVYRWRVQAGQEAVFVQAWRQGTAAMRAGVRGAGGSLLMQSYDAPSEFMALACWASMEAWQAFTERRGAAPDPEAFQALAAVSELVSTELLEEKADLLDCSWEPDARLGLQPPA